MIKKLTANDLRSLKYGDKVYRNDGGVIYRTLTFVALMPRSPNYLIFCDGEYLTHLHINPDNDRFAGTWYDADLTIDEMDQLSIEYYQDKIDFLKANPIK